MMKIKNIVNRFLILCSFFILIASVASGVVTNDNQVIVLGGDKAIASGAQGDILQKNIGDGSWKSVLGTKMDFYLDPTTTVLGSFKIDDIQSISYKTKKPGAAGDVDFYLVIYTTKDSVDDESTWYGYRLNGEPYFSKSLNAPTAIWNTWNTNDGDNQLTFFDSAKNAGTYGFYGQPDLQDFQTGTINWNTYNPAYTNQDIDYGNEVIKYISFQTESGWKDTFNGNIDAVVITLNNGKSLTIDLEKDYPTQVYVDDDGICDGNYPCFDKIQDAINTVAEGGTVNVNAGTYDKQIIINKNDLIIQSTDGATNTIIIPSDTTNGGIVISGDGNTIDGFTIKDFTDNSNENKIIRINGNNNIIKNNIIQGNLNQEANDQTEYGILFQSTASGNTIDSNEVYDIGYMGINVAPDTGTSSNIIKNNNIHDIGIYAIGIDRSPNNFVTQNTISNLVGGDLWGNYYDPAVWCWGIIVWGANSAGTIIDDQDLTNLPNGIALSAAQQITVKNSEVYGNQNIGIKLADSSWIPNSADNNIIQYNEIYNNNDGIVVKSGGFGGIGTNNAINYNKIYTNSQYGVKNEVIDVTINVENNYWGSNTPDFATIISGDVDYEPWTDETFTNQYFAVDPETGSANYEVEDVGGVTITPTEGSGEDVITINIESLTSDDVEGEEAVGIPALGKFVRIESDIANENIDKVEIRIYYDEEDLPEGVIEENLIIYYYDGMNWVPAATEEGKFGVVTDEDYVWAITDHLTDFGIFSDIDGPLVIFDHLSQEYPNPNDDELTVYVYATITDVSGVKDYPELRWRIVGREDIYGSPTMTQINGDLYYGGITAPKLDGLEVEYKIVAEDSLGNPGESSYYYEHLFTYDGSVPTVTISGAPEGWTNINKGAGVNCQDGYSGCDATSYRLLISDSQIAVCSNNYGDYILTSPQTITSHKWVCAVAKDNAGNIGFSNPVEFMIDATAPTVTVTGAPIDWVNINQDAIVNCADELIGCNLESYGYKIYTENPESCSTTPADYIIGDSVLVLASNSRQWVCGYAQDNAGNDGFSTPVEFKVDSVVPVLEYYSRTNPLDDNMKADDTDAVGIGRGYYDHIGDGFKWISDDEYLQDISIKFYNGNPDEEGSSLIDGANVEGCNLDPLWSEPTDGSTIDEIFYPKYKEFGLWGSDFVGNNDNSDACDVFFNNLHNADGIVYYEIKAYDLARNEGRLVGILDFKQGPRDIIKPETSDNVDGIWHNSDVTVTLTCIDENGCDKTYYTTDGTDPTTISNQGTSIILIDEGEYTIKYFSTDYAYNVEDVKTAVNTVKIDTTYPIFQVNDETEVGPVATDTININVIDDNLDLASLKYRFSLDETCDATDLYENSFENNVEFVIDETHIDYLCAEAADSAGNVVYHLVGQLNIDNDNPTLTPVSIASNHINSGYAGVGNTVTINFESNEPIIQNPVVTIDGDLADIVMQEDAQHWSATRVMKSENTEGQLEFTIDYVDLSGNDGDQVILTTDESFVIFDETEPEGELLNIPESWTGETVNLELICNDYDNDCDLNELYLTVIDYGMDCTPVDKYTVPLSVSQHSTACWTVDDMAGNRVGGEAEIMVDQIAPTIIDNAPVGWQNTNVIVTLTPNDEGGSGLKEVRYCEGVECTTPNILLDDPYKLYYMTDQDRIIKYRAWDNVGHPSEVGQFNVKIDTVKPGITNSGPGGTLTTNDVELFVTTNEITTCRYDFTDMDYDAMTYQLGDVDLLNHTYYISDINDGTYLYHIKCKDKAGNVDKTSVLFIIDTAANYGYTKVLNPIWDSFTLPMFILEDLGYTTQESRIPSNILTSLDENYEILWYYDGSDWLSYDPIAPPWVNDLVEFDDVQSNPYWIKMINKDRLELPELEQL